VDSLSDGLNGVVGATVVGACGLACAGATVGAEEGAIGPLAFGAATGAALGAAVGATGGAIGAEGTLNSGGRTYCGTTNTGGGFTGGSTGSVDGGDCRWRLSCDTTFMEYVEVVSSASS